MDPDDTLQRGEQVVTLTESAVARAKRLLEERNLRHHALRVFVSGSGCCGLQYGMAIESQPHETDRHFHMDGLDVVIDPVSLEYLAGATIGYVEGPTGTGFKIDNPNAIAACECGQSSRAEVSPSSEGCACGS